MATIQNFLLSYPKVGFFMMVLIVLLVTTVIKLPLKHLTAKIKNEKTRKFVNSFFILLALAVGLGVGWLYTWLTGGEFKIEVGFLLSVMGISTYDLLEIVKRAFALLVDSIKKGKDMKLEDITEIIEDVKDKKSPKKSKKDDEVADAIKEFENICKK